MKNKFIETLKSIVREGKTVRMRVNGFSMFPTLVDGDEVEIVRAKKIKPGNIIVFHKGNFLCIHRVKKVSNNLIWTKGDFKISKDFPISLNQVIGRVKRKSMRAYPRLRKILHLLSGSPDS